MLKDDLIRLLKATIEAIEDGDTMEGRLQYEWGDTPGTYNVNAFVRVGNSQGQGGVMLVNEKLRDA